MEKKERFRTAAHVCRIVLGAVFLFSGLAKGIDPWGSALKVEEDLNAFGLGGLSAVCCSSRRGAVRGGVRRRTHAPVRYGTSAGQSFRPALHGILHPADPRDSRVESVGRLRLFRECAQVEQLDDLRQERRTAARGGGGVARCEEAPRVRLYSARGGPEHDIPPFTVRTLPVCVVLPAAGGYVGLP